MRQTLTWRSRGRFGFIALAAAMLVVASLIAACSNGALTTPGGGGGSQSDSGGVVHNFVNGTQAVPTFPPFTIGAWVDNYAPNLNDNINVYVVVRQQDPTMQGPAKPKAGVTVVLTGGASASQQTDSVGYAKIPLIATGQPGTPTRIGVSATIDGVTYKTETFYTCLPNSPPVPSTVTPTPGG
jgi:hypothetical protein